MSLLPTPTTINASSQKAKTGRPTSGPQRGGPSFGLEDVVADVFPTPRASRGASTTETAYALGAQRSDVDRPQGEVLFPSPCAGDGDAGRPWGRNGTQINLPGVARQLAGDESVLPGEESRYHGAKPDGTHYLPTPASRDHKGGNRTVSDGNGGRRPVDLDDVTRARGDGGASSLSDAVQLLPTPCAQQSANTPENHLAKKPGRKQVTDLAILVENGLLETGGELPALPTPTSRDHKGRNQRDDETCLTGALLPTPQAQDGGGPHGDRGGYRPSRAGRQASLSDALTDPALLPTPAASDGDGGKTSRSGDRKDEPLLGNIAALLPTPNAADGDRGKGPRSEEKLAQTRQGDDRLDRQKGLPDLPRLLPTPAAADSDRRQDYARADREGSGGDDLVTAAVKATGAQAWGKYAPAIERWESFTRPAPPPTEPNTKGNPRLSPAFSEWLMGWPLGWVTEKGLIGRNDQLRIIGNGVVPQQAAAALMTLLTIIAQDEAA